MNPKGYPSASVPLQGVPYGQPEGPGMVQHTTVNIITEPPNDHIIWSIFNLFYMNPCCLGLAALIHSVKARDRKVVGDLQGAQHYGSTARSLNIVATILICLFALIVIIAYSVLAGRISASIHNSYGSSSSYDYRGLRKCKSVTICFVQLVLLPSPNTLKRESTLAGTHHFFNRFLHTLSKTAVELRAMNPQVYPSAPVPLQRVPYGQPEGPGMFQHTTVNIIAEPPNDHIIWSIFNFIYMNPCCLGLAALIHSVKARDRKMVGDLQGAQHHGFTARSINIVASIMICLLVIGIIAYSVLAANAKNSYSNNNSNGPYRQ